MYDIKSAAYQWRGKINNAQGQCFENYLKSACEIYKSSERAMIEKTPEPFRVLEKHRDGKFTGRFTAHAQPDFLGTLKGGRSICFEAKYTSTDRINRSVLTQTQMDSLEYHYRLGAVSGVCIGIQDEFFFIPWEIWRDMKAHYKRQYLKTNDIQKYRVKFTGAIMFLDYLN